MLLSIVGWLPPSIVARMPMIAGCPPMMVGCPPLLLVDGLPMMVDGLQMMVDGLPLSTVDEPSLIGFYCWLSKGCRWLAAVADVDGLTGYCCLVVDGLIGCRC